jgi:histidyl-tRNA synthetase
VGFALGLDRIVLSVMSSREDQAAGETPDVYVVTVTPDLRARALELVVELRRHSLAADMDYESRSVKAQFRAANKSGADHVVVLGPDEAAKGMVKLKTLSSGDEREVPQDGLAGELGAK